jgi:hypothetical protein
MSGRLDAQAALHPGKEPRISIGHDAGVGARAGLDDVERRLILLFRDSNSDTAIQPVAMAAIPLSKFQRVERHKEGLARDWRSCKARSSPILFFTRHRHC